ncbi:MAG: hypothetical protein JSW61_04105 [Candidatus Thorarchaeota archaeon]|nr:MAG: hypothetical protein JSW61_04105 [Candidatus Thorarchaeota archaeon]
MKLYYKINPENYRECLEAIRDKFGMNEEVDEERTTLALDDESRIELVRGTFDPNRDELAHVRVILHDDTLRAYFDSVLGEPYKVID